MGSLSLANIDMGHLAHSLIVLSLSFLLSPGNVMTKAHYYHYHYDFIPSFILDRILPGDSTSPVRIVDTGNPAITGNIGNIGNEQNTNEFFLLCNSDNDCPNPYNTTQPNGVVYFACDIHYNDFSDYLFNSDFDTICHQRYSRRKYSNIFL